MQNKIYIKTYEIKYILGIINPIEKKINIESVEYPTEKFILKEIEKKEPEKSQIISITQVLLIKEKILDNKISNKNNNNNVSFNW